MPNGHLQYLFNVPLASERIFFQGATNLERMKKFTGHPDGVGLASNVVTLKEVECQIRSLFDQVAGVPLCSNGYSDHLGRKQGRQCGKDVGGDRYL